MTIPPLPSRPPDRLERLRSWMSAQRVTCTVVLGSNHITHLTGYSRYFGGPAALVITDEGERTLVVMQDEVAIAAAGAKADAVLGYGERGFGINLDPVADLLETLLTVPAVAGADRMGLGSELPGADVRFAALLSCEVVSADHALHDIRMVKDWDELERIHAAYDLCWRGQDAVARGVAPGSSEIELFTAALSTAQIAAGGPIEFVSDLLSGVNTAAVCAPIHVAGTRLVEAGDAVVADVALRTNGYWGDTAETYAAGDNADVSAARAVLLDVLEEARKALVPGATGSDVFAAMHARVVDALPGSELPHHGGHAIGLTGFEDPHLIPSDAMPLESWMVLAVEPGAYFPGRFGARVERVFVVTPSGGVELRDLMRDGDGSR